MGYNVVYILYIAVTSLGLLASAVYSESEDASNERPQRQRRQTGAGGAYSSSGTFAWWKIVLVVIGGLAGMEILYCCCKNYLRKQGNEDNEKSKVQKVKDNRTESSVTINEQSANHLRKNNSFVEAMKLQGYSTLRDYNSPGFYYPPPPMSSGIKPSYPQKNTFYVEQPTLGNDSRPVHLTHHLMMSDTQSLQWGHTMHPLLGASTFV
ncbi:uncharacterized protein [Antedon mediterranea]|uniref:uncharacterized protein n=1 Tax=Antedon mediterranea TaxID=105859 RepID=UPI003AF9717A